MRLLSKVVFMTQGKRFGLSAVERSEVWCRLKAGQSLPEIGRAQLRSKSRDAIDWDGRQHYHIDGEGTRNYGKDGSQAIRERLAI